MLPARGASTMIGVFTFLTITFSLPLTLAQSCTLNNDEVLSVNSNVVCESQYSWMDNHMQQSPCLVYAYLMSSCNEGSWTISPLNNNPITSYSTPGMTCVPTDVCECSWAAYNLISACTQCQGPAFAESIHTWDAYKTNCTGYYSTTTYWPTSNFTVPNVTAIPFWASTDPMTWPNGQFDATTAQNEAGQGHADLPTPTSTVKKTPVGAIVGGVVGGIAGLLIILGIVAWLVIRRRRQARAAKEFHTDGNNPTLHKHSLSETTQFSRDISEMGTYTPLNLGGMPAATIAQRTNTFVTRRQPSTEFTINSTDAEFPSSPSRAGLHSRSTSGDTGSIASLRQPPQSIDAILSTPRALTSPSLLDDDDQDSSSASPRARPRFNPPAYEEAIANSPPRPEAGGTHSRSQSNESVPQAPSTSTPGSDIKKEKKRLVQEMEPDTSADISADVSADASLIREKAPRD